MDFKKIVLLVGALMVAAVTAIMAKNMFSGAGAQQAAAAPAEQGSKVLVAKKSLPVGTIIDATSIGFEVWPKDSVQPSFFEQGTPNSDPSKLLGTVVRYPITAGQPLTRGAVVGPQDRGFLAAALGAGMRAITVPVNASAGVAGFVFPGDRVDMVLTQEVAGGGDGAPLRVSETIIRNIRVLAVDQRLNARDEQGNQVAQTVSTVTFEATPRIAEAIAVAQTIGQLSLSLRSLADNNAELERAIASGEVQVPQGDDPRAERQMLLAVANRPSNGPSTYTVGADVSRFQRGSVPGRARDDNNNNGGPPPASGGGAGAVGVDGRPAGPVVRVARGNAVTLVPVGAR